MVASRVAGTIPILIAVCLLNLPALAQYSGGSGSPDDPYRIATAEDLILLGETPQDYDKHFVLTADIDLDPNLPGRKVFGRAVIAPDVNDVWDQFDGTPFTGVLDGDGHTVHHLTISGHSYLGLFGQLGQSGAVGRVLDLGLEAVDVSGTGRCVGSLAGASEGTISTCYGTGTITGEINVGGLVGHSWPPAVINASYSRATVTGWSNVGGFVGTNRYDEFGRTDGGIIRKCYSGSRVSGEYNAGGFVGEGLPAFAHMNVWDLELSGLERASLGGVGLTTTEMMDSHVLGLNGFGGDPNWVLDAGRDYPRLAWQGTAGEIIPEPNMDWIAGEGTGKRPYRLVTADQLVLMTKASVFWDKHLVLDADIDLDPALPDRKIFDQAVFPSFTGFFDGSGHTIAHLTITGGRDLGLFGVLSERAVVSNLSMEAVNVSGTGSTGGLAGMNLGNIVMCRMTGMVNGAGWSIGGLVGQNMGNILASSSRGTTQGEGGVGNLVGTNWGNILTSYSEGATSGESAVGGLVGINAATITDSHSRGSVEGDKDVGGLVGENGTCCPGGVGTIARCHSVTSVLGAGLAGGLVGAYGGPRLRDGDPLESVSNSFWGIDATGHALSAGGIGLTTAEMQTATAFLHAGWDFVDEVANGTDDIWKMWDGYDYPRLAWEVGPNTPLVFVDVNDPGFCGQVSRYEVTNDQYCDFLNAALASGDIIVNGTKIEGAGGSNSGEDYAGQLYYNGDGSGYTGYGAANGGAARIRYDAGAFGVENGFGNHPVTYVSWYGAMAFANYYGYYLPAEDQWQAVADYDGTYVYGCGQIIGPGIANCRPSEHPDGTMPVGSFGAYGYGMSDMAGNVWEWTSSSLGNNRVFRGGSLGSVESDCAVSIRGDGIPHAAYWDIGFRVCR